MTDAEKEAFGKLQSQVAEQRKALLALAGAVNTLNRRSGRVREVEEALKLILAPNDEEFRANETVAQALANRQRIGRVLSAFVEWDSQWRFVLHIRGEGGYGLLENLDLRPDTYGLAALCDVLNAYGIENYHDKIQEPKPAAAGTVERIILFP